MSKEIIDTPVEIPIVEEKNCYNPDCHGHLSTYRLGHYKCDKCGQVWRDINYFNNKEKSEICKLPTS